MSDPVRLSWRDTLRRVDWRQGEHVAVIGPTESGKTVASLAMLAERERRGGYICCFATKPVDPAMTYLIRSCGYERVREWPPSPQQRPRGKRHKYVLWPQQHHLGDTAGQIEQARELFKHIWKSGAWCVFIDETYWVSNRLGMDQAIRDLHLQGRSLGITMVSAIQRPRHVPLEIYSSASHILCFRTNAVDDLKRIREISGSVDTRQFERTVSALSWDAHELVWADTRRGELVVTTAEPR